MVQESIVIKGAREHNLKNINVTIPRDKLVVITGLSGSGKSSLAFDTIYAEGQRRYVESLSSYARQFLGQMNKPDLDSIDGLSPAVSIDQKTTSKNPRSTVGTTTEIYDYLRLLYARLGIPHCPECGRVIKMQTTDQVVDDILNLGEDIKALMLSPVVIGRKGEFTKLFADLASEGFARVRIDGEVTRLEGSPITLDKKLKHTIEVIVDRVSIKKSARSRLAEAVEMATKLSDGKVAISLVDGDNKGAEHTFSLALACPEHGHSIDKPQPRDFSFNAPYGACPDCLGLGSRDEIDSKLIIPDPSLSISQGAIAPFSTGNYYPQVFEAVLKHFKASPDTPWEDLPVKVKNGMLKGVKDTKIKIEYTTVDGRDTYWYLQWDGVLDAVSKKFTEAQTDNMREKFGRYFSTVACKSCSGKRLRPEILAITINGKSIIDFCEMSITQALDFTSSLKFEGAALTIAAPIVKEVSARLDFLNNVGLDYLTLERATASLSGGEAQRIRLATQIGAGLMGVLYILDEPSIGLHQRDNERLISTLEHLRDLGNTVLVVEHDEDTIRSADYILDLGPGAGEHGGEIVAEGSIKDILKSKKSLTAGYLNGRLEIPIPAKRKDPKKGEIKLTGACENNLKNLEISIPLGTLSVVTGVSGSGKSSLITDTLSPALCNRVNRSRRTTGAYDKLQGSQLIDKVINIDQSPIGRTPRSNPATYVGIWDDVRSLFASTQDAKARGYAPGRFSFNVAGGRCEACKGDGQIKIEMHFLPDIYVPCETCNAKRYNRETLQVKYKGKNVFDVLDMTVEEALEFFGKIPSLKRKLQTLHDVGLSYIRLGQAATTLSGGEAQRIKLAKELHKRQTGSTFYILDEPTTGLHFDDVRQLLEVLQRLVESGNTVLVIEHNLDIIKCADYIIDLGPEGGSLGGNLVVCGTPEKVANTPTSHTGRFLYKILSSNAVE